MVTSSLRAIVVRKAWHLPRLLAPLVALLLAATPVHALQTIIVDAGHGGHDRGGIPGQRHPEKVYTLDTARRLEKILRDRGYKVVMTRRDDRFISLDSRARIANQTKNSIFVSVHFDSYWRRGADGVTTYTIPRSGAASLARSVHRELIRGLKPRTNRGIKTARFFVLRKTKMPAILVEGGFLTNAWESERITDRNYRQRLAEAIADGIDQYSRRRKRD